MPLLGMLRNIALFSLVHFHIGLYSSVPNCLIDGGPGSMTSEPWCGPLAV